ncbi:molybdenum cofactor guanylyltransferase [Pusillimonas sp. MFBS29]|uniref:molybdenum cofactor guanylyltransferase MobA n=1 Tax=Pusillimonas sp. MFBS29 TaxID=2886690 RepID=UPI001D11B424|nr:molybdenum cofactor guanylyltransferase MobA [Pusillimonas sp. MFBS29]MCC2594836.1 molybdenum cofactor guanylyltransferase [Pusillimonas sp. MFBS29]
MIASDSVTGLILAGGQARRMQMVAEHAGTVIDKGMLDLQGEPLVRHAQRFLAPHVQNMLISANRNEAAYGAYGNVIKDDPLLGSALGPLAGIERALALAPTPWLLVLPVDVVNLPSDLVPRLLRVVDEQAAPIAYARTEQRVHPLCMALHVRLADSLRRYLMDGDRKVQLWQNRHHTVPVLFEGDELFFNVNTPEDLSYANQCWKS